jgi:hypothetical protein
MVIAARPLAPLGDPITGGAPSRRRSRIVRPALSVRPAARRAAGAVGPSSCRASPSISPSARVSRGPSVRTTIVVAPAARSRASPERIASAGSLSAMPARYAGGIPATTEGEIVASTPTTPPGRWSTSSRWTEAHRVEPAVQVKLVATSGRPFWTSAGNSSSSVAGASDSSSWPSATAS